MKKVKQFKIGDKVFAKVKGYPPWPAVVINDSGKKFSVQFYGTGEMGFIKPEDLFHYLKHKTQFMKASKKKEFFDALTEIELAIEKDQNIDEKDPNLNTETEIPKTSNVDDNKLKRKRSISEKSSDELPRKKSVYEKNSDPETDSVKNVDVDNEEISENSKCEVTEEIESESITDKLDNDEANETVLNEDIEEETEPNPKNGEPCNSDVKIVSEENLQHFIVYADHVKKNPDFYKSKPMEAREYFVNQVFPVLLPTSKYIGLKLHKKWPLKFSNEYDCAMYDEEIASRLLLLKESVTGGKIMLEDEPDSLLLDFNMTESEIKAETEMKLISKKYKKIERLRSESTLVELDANIKNSLSLDKADTVKALTYLNTMMEINVDELMLKKHSHVVEMIRRLRKYVGNMEDWDLDEKALEQFMSDAQKIREKAEIIFEKFKNIIKVPDGHMHFWDGFNEVVAQFQNKCKDLTNREIFVLCSEPDSRHAFIDRLELSDEINRVDDIVDIEKENSSEIANTE